MTDIGIMFRREHAPEHLPSFARRAEEAGFDSVVLVPLPDKELAELDLFAGRLLPLL